MKIKIAFLFLATLVLSACHDHEDSATMKEAKAIHDSMIKLQSQLEETIGAKTSQIEEKLNVKMAEGDTLAAEHLQNLNEQLNRWHTSLHQWEGDMVEIPGHAHTHAEGEECDHGTHAASLEGLADEEILAIQNELAKKLDSIKAGLEQIEIGE